MRLLLVTILHPPGSAGCAGQALAAVSLAVRER